MFGLPSKKERKQSAAWWAAQADKASKTAREEARQANVYRQRLNSGTSTDPEADRYLLRQHEENQRLAETNARDYRQAAG